MQTKRSKIRNTGEGRIAMPDLSPFALRALVGSHGKLSDGLWRFIGSTGIGTCEAIFKTDGNERATLQLPSLLLSVAKSVPSARVGDYRSFRYDTVDDIDRYRSM